MTIFANRIRRNYLRKCMKRQILKAAVLLLVFVVPYVVVAGIDRPGGLDCFTSTERAVCLVSWADSAPMY